MTAGPRAEFTQASRRLYEGSLQQMDFFREVDAHPPDVFTIIARAVLQEEMEQETARLLEGQGDAARLRGILQRAERLEVVLDLTPLQRALADAVAGWVWAVRSGGEEDLVQRATFLLEVAESPGLSLDLWEAQSRFHRAVTAPGPTQDGRERLAALGRSLGFS